MSETAITEEITDVVEAVVPEIVETVQKARANPVIVVAGVGAGLLIGGAAGYFIARKKLEKDYDTRLDAELEEMRSGVMSDLLKKEGNFETPAKALETLEPLELLEEIKLPEVEDIPEDAKAALEKYASVNYRKISTEAVEEDGAVTAVIEQTERVEGNDIVEEVKTVTNNVFVNGDPYQAPASDDEPEIITQETYLKNETEADQITLTYYAKDDVLVDDQDQPINDISVVGENNLRVFRDRPGGITELYIRNAEMDADLEIVHSFGSYTEEVLGITPDDEEMLGLETEGKNELRHSRRRTRHDWQ